MIKPIIRKCRNITRKLPILDDKYVLIKGRKRRKFGISSTNGHISFFLISV
jgi:hypothetical protein